MRQGPFVLQGSNLEIVDRGLLDGLYDILETHFNGIEQESIKSATLNLRPYKLQNTE